MLLIAIAAVIGFILGAATVFGLGAALMWAPHECSYFRGDQ
jgi:choline-glycine betaine transporter